MNSINRQRPAAREAILGGNLITYLSQFFGEVIPPDAMDIDSWEELREYLSNFINLKIPEQGGAVSHRAHGFEKDHLPTVILKTIIY